MKCPKCKGKNTSLAITRTGIIQLELVDLRDGQIIHTNESRDPGRITKVFCSNCHYTGTAKEFGFVIPEMHTAKTHANQIKYSAPLLTPDNHGGTYIIIEADAVCPKCGGLGTSRKMYTWKGTKNIDPREVVEYGYGGCTGTLFTVCNECSYASGG